MYVFIYNYVFFYCTYGHMSERIIIIIIIMRPYTEGNISGFSFQVLLSSTSLLNVMHVTLDSSLSNR